MKRGLFLVALACALAGSSAGAAPFRVSKVELFFNFLLRDSSCPQATHLFVRRCQISGDIPQYYARFRENEDVSALEDTNTQVNVRGMVSKVQHNCSLPILESPKMEPQTDIFDCFD
ncbi:MAG: hypothetical protein ACREAA_19910 [Candidatus Polarisedimenticolia bacterium]